MSWAKFSLHRILVCGAVAMFAAGCAFSHKPPPPPLVADKAAAVSVHHFQGTPLSGTVLKPADPVDPDEALGVEVRFYALEQSPQGIDPLGARARLIVASHGAYPVRSTGGLTRTATYATGADAERLFSKITTGGFQRSVPVGDASGALAPGTTARFEITDSGKPDATLPSGLGHRRFGVQICRPEKFLFTRNRAQTRPATGPTTQPATNPTGEEIELAVVLDDVAPAEAPSSSDMFETASAGPPPLSTPILHMETVLLDPIFLDIPAGRDRRPTAVLAVPFRLRDGSNQSMAALIRITRGSSADKAFRAVCASASKDLTDAFHAAEADALARPPASPDEATVLDLLASVARPQSRRAASAYLAAWSGARICEDVILSCDDKVLAELTGAFSKDVAQVAKEKPAVGWRMDRITLQFLTKLQGDSHLPPELAALLSDRAGEAGRHASAMEEVLKGIAGPLDLDERLVAINRLYLEDSSPGSRARAYDWLKNRNRHEEPAGYLPLAPARERRAALEQDAADRANAATRPTTQITGVP